MRTMKSGDLRHPVTLLRPERNGRTVEWVEAAHMYAAKADVSGREFYEAQAYHMEDVVTFTLRPVEGISASWRIRHGEDTYNIIEVNHLGYMGDYIRLKCRIVTGGGT